MSTTTHRRRVSGRNKAIGAVVALGLAGGVAFALTSSAQAASVGAAYSKTSGWSGGYTGQYVITNDTDKALADWKLEFDLPAGTKISSLWNAEDTVSGQHVTVKPASWDTTGIAPGKTLTVGFVANSGADAGDPTGCLINNTACSVDSTTPPTATATATPSASASASATPTATASATATATASPTPTATSTSGTSTAAGFSPYVDTSLYPVYDLVAQSKATGVKDFNLAFITDGGSCTPKFGGVTDVGSDAVASQVGDLRALGGDVRVSFGGASGTELGTSCSSVSALQAAYEKVISAYKLTKVDFDIEGGAITNTAANTLRAKAIAGLQSAHPGLEVSYTLPVMPEGLTADGVSLVKNAADNGVNIDAVNIMAMDYGGSYSGDMGTYAEQAATATQAQVKSALGISDSAAWAKVAVTPMIGVNDVNTEIFKVDDATQLATFAKEKGLAWISMWSGARDKECSGGAKNYADPTCSSIVQDANAFAKAFAAYTK
ncbi:glycoside hydrolase family 18 protein [Streptomyces sp. NBC_01465]|uniref:glycoside hydrolase family 18 protein n=1 Tax=Streptomyces sp. NBC_01465 TaxID=2903878 RepID=UPI002E36643E|nr:cellulose binding domain-containing protein [Streptomyces sp. NBC_01465]